MDQSILYLMMDDANSLRLYTARTCGTNYYNKVLLIIVFRLCSHVLFDYLFIDWGGWMIIHFFDC